MNPHSAPGSVTAVGIDVGGARKGFHAVALRDGAYACRYSTSSVEELATWCRTTARARAIAVDAPCRWSRDDRSRPAERALMGKGIWCFSTPTRQRALDHPKNHFGWMLRGEALFKELESSHRLCVGLPIATDADLCFETFPHAIAWHLTGGQAVASRKRTERRDILQRAGIDTGKLSSIDFVDAALCALVAHRAVTGGACASYGEPSTGLIIVPES